MISPGCNGGADHRAHALDRFQTPDADGEHLSRIASQFLEQAVERDRTDIWQRVQHEKRLSFGQLVTHVTNLQLRFRSATKFAAYNEGKQLRWLHPISGRQSSAAGLAMRVAKNQQAGWY